MNRSRIVQSARGFSTLEAILAMAIMMATLSAVMLTSHGNQTLLIDGHRDAEARMRASALLATLEARAADDFNLINPVPATTTGAYTTHADVTLLPDHRTKRVSATASWQDELGRVRSITLTTLLTNFAHAIAGDTCSSALEGDWNEPNTVTYALRAGDLFPLDANGSATIRGLDAYDGVLYVAADTTSTTNAADFFLFDISNPAAKPKLIAQLDTDPSANGGPGAVRATGKYVYIADGHGREENCTPGPDCAQLQMVDTSLLSTPKIIASYLIPTTTPAFVLGSGSQAVGESLWYENGLVYLGLSKTKSGPEFNIIDVRDPTNPAWLGGYSVGRTINAVVLRGSYAYLATDDDTSGGQAIVVLDVHDPKNPSRITAWSGAGAGFAESLAAVGSRLYLGRSYANGSQHEFSVIDATTPENGLDTQGGADVGTGLRHESVNALSIRDTFAFLVTSNDIELWNVADTAHIGPAIAPIPLPFGSEGTAIDCEGNMLYVGSVAGNTGYLTVVTSSSS